MALATRLARESSCLTLAHQLRSRQLGHLRLTIKLQKSRARERPKYTARRNPAICNQIMLCSVLALAIQVQFDVGIADTDSFHELEVNNCDGVVLWRIETLVDYFSQPHGASRHRDKVSWAVTVSTYMLFDLLHRWVLRSVKRFPVTAAYIRCYVKVLAVGFGVRGAKCYIFIPRDRIYICTSIILHYQKREEIFGGKDTYRLSRHPLALPARTITALTREGIHDGAA